VSLWPFQHKDYYS